MLSLEKIRELMSDRKLYMVAEGTGLTYPTLKRILDGKANPNYSTIVAISKYFENEQK